MSIVYWPFLTICRASSNHTCLSVKMKVISMDDFSLWYLGGRDSIVPKI